MTRSSAVRLVVMLSALGLGGLVMPGPARPQDVPAAVGKITDREGTALRKGLAEPRWSAADERTPVHPGDWLKVGARGANALAAEVGGAALVLGPGAQVEVVDAGRIRLHAGEVEVTPPASGKLVVEGPDKVARQVEAREALRASGTKLEGLKADPRWLVGYREQSPTEAVGALLATVDGRNVPLTLGYHKVVVDIRDQVARTEIEERFVNHTSTVLEGVFYFPLPADASISGFSMWIGDEQVHGEIVEKQRARAIYETILREKRDPGLLEWAGGNVFKARVYPIGAEKRIKISYTQVLPQTRRQDGKGEFVYHHALRSELLRLTPLKQLAVTVTVSSSRPIVEVTCPGLPARVQATAKAAKVEHEAEEVTPERDLEVRVVTDVGADPSQASLAFLPHRRAEDGYFLLLVDGPRAPAKPATEPLDLLILADTSGSLAGPAREAQGRLVAALLEGLGPQDTVDLATCDGEVRWAFGAATPSGEARDRALAHLDARTPLGWTDLDAAVKAAAERAGPRTQVVYVGDGAVTTGDADASAFARRAPSLYKGQGTFHAIVPGTTSEMPALRALAALGGGTVRALGGADATDLAFAFLAEVTAPRVKGLALAFEGVEVAAVHPEVLPDLPAGRQQVVVGRWNPATLPAGGAKGRVRLTGTLDGKPVAAVTEVALGGPASDGEDASFVPRLWARAHLDHLLMQGSGKAVQEQVIGLSEDFQLITPYTSFLVLESDADRERFQVKKSFRMRDGEEFFAKGREDATHELTRQAVLAAKRWRRELRARTLEALADMNRGLTAQLVGVAIVDYEFASGGLGATSTTTGDRYFAANRMADVAMDGGDMPSPQAAPAPSAEPMAGEEDAADDAREADGDEDASKDAEAPADAPASELEAPPEQPVLAEEKAVAKVARQEMAAGRARRAGPGGYRAPVPQAPGLFLPKVEARPGSPFDGLLPGVGGPADPAWTWPGDAGARDALLPADLRRSRVEGRKEGGLRLTVRVQRPDRRGKLQPMGEGLWLLGADRWLTASVAREGEDVRLDWVDAGRRGALTAAWLLGQHRPSVPGDAAAWPRPWAWGALEDFAGYAAWTTVVKPAAGGLVEVTFTAEDGRTRLVVRVEPARGLLHEVAWFEGERAQWRQAFEEFVEVGGAWWPTKITRTDEAGATVEALTVAVEALPAKALQDAIAEALSPLPRSVLVGPLPAPRAARAAVREGKGTFEDRWVVLGTLAAAQRWPAARPHLDALLEAAKVKLAADALLATALLHSRRHEELRLHVASLARALVAAPRVGEVAVAQQHLLGWSYVFHDGDERLELVRRLRAVVERHPVLDDSAWLLDQAESSALQSTGRTDEAAAVLRAAIARDPRRVEPHVQLAYLLNNAGDPEAAVAAVDEALAKHGPWPRQERAQLAGLPVQLLWSAQRLDAVVARVERLEREDPASAAAVGELYLTALVMSDRADEAWEKAKAWTAPALQGAVLKDEALQRLNAGVGFALGRNAGGWTDRIEEDRAAHLAQVARALARTVEMFHVVEQIAHDWRFARSAAGAALVRELGDAARREVATLPPALLARLLPFAMRGDLAARDREALLDALEARWRAALEANDEANEPALRSLALSWADGPRQLRLWRSARDHAVKVAKGVREAQVALAYVLAAQPWTAEHEAEALGLLDDAAPLADADEATRRAQLAEQVQLLHALVDHATQARAAAVVAARPDHDGLDRRRLRVARDEALRAARVEVAQRLAALSLGAEVDRWARLERAWLLVKLGRADAETVAALGRDLEAALADAAAPHPWTLVYAARAVATLLNLAATDRTDVSRAARARADALISAKVAGDDGLLDWREAKLALHLIDDRPADLEATLRAWFGDGAAPEQARWGVPLTFVLAERDALADAVDVMARVEALDEAGAADLQRLALWLTALDRKEDAKAAKARAWALVDEWQLQQSIQQDLQRVARRGEGVPEELDPETTVKLLALFRKAEWPQHHLWTVQQLYQTTRDFRVLEALAEGVLGHTAQKVYALLSSLRQVTDSLQEEATLDRLQKAIAALHGRPGASAVDRRALRLLEALVAHRAATQRQGASEHVKAAVDALRAAWALAEARETGWTPGEPLLYAQLLAGQGAMAGAVGDEQRRQLQALVALGATPAERLDLTGHLAQVLWQANRRDEALRALAGAIDAARRPDGLLAPRQQPHLSTLSGFLCASGRFLDAERLWQRELGGKPGHGVAVARQLRVQLLQVYVQALGADGEVSLGRGKKLYEAARDAVRADLAARTHESHAMQLVSVLTSLWNTAAHRHRLPVGDDVKKFAFGELPALLALYQHRQAASFVGMVVDALQQHAGPGVALELLVARAEAEPAWLRLQHQNAWQQHGWRFTNLRAEAARQRQLTPLLEGRLLELVLRELGRDLRAHAGPPSICAHVHSGDFWTEKRDDFAKVARQVLAERRDVEPTVLHVAQYLWNLELFDEAIAALADADRRKLLGRSGRTTLCVWLQSRERWAESLPVAERLVEEEPRALDSRQYLALALFRTGKPDAAAQAVKTAEAYLREVKAWDESAAATLGALCVTIQQPAEAARLLGDAIALHTRSRPDRGVGGGTLSSYYQQLSQAYQQLGQTEAAVDAACGAVVAWGRHQTYERGAALANLGSILEQAPDLDAYVAKLDQETAASGLENPTLRRALGEVYARTERPEQAEAQLRRSLEAQPNDPEVHRALIAVLDALGKKDEAAAQLLALAEVSGHDAKVYEELGDRWTQAGRAADAERAYTNLVEMLPEEAESHRTLATVRERQGRLPDAIVQWRQVVRVRTDEPAGWLGLGRALLRQGEKAEAAEVAKKLLGTTWEARFGDVHQEARDLLQKAGG